VTRVLAGVAIVASAVVTARGGFLLRVGAAPQQARDGAAVYTDFCAGCHDTPDGRIPSRDALKARTPEAIVLALSSGSMTLQAQMLNAAEKRAVAEYLAGQPLGTTDSGSGKASRAVCGAAPDGPNMRLGRGWNGWGSDAANTRYQPDPGISVADVPQLKLKWAVGFPGGALAYSQPTITGGHVFVGSDNGRVYALGANDGCTYWSFAADAGVRTAVITGPIGSTRYAAYFGDTKGNVYAVDASSGGLIWKKQADAHRFARITGAPALYDGRLYAPVSSIEESVGGRADYACCTFRGSIVAYDAASGAQLWKTYTIPEEPREVGKNAAGTAIMKPAGAAVWNSPTLDVTRGVLYIGTGNSYTEPAVDTSDSVMAIDMKSGRMLWHNQVTPKDAFVMGCRPGADTCPKEVGPDFDFGNSPILRTLPDGKRILVIGQKSGMAYGLDPDQQGRKLWEFRAGQGSALGGIEWGSAADEQNAYIPVSDVLSPANESGGLFALKLATGEAIWHTPHPHLDCTAGRGCSGAQSAPISVMPGAVFSGSVDGHLRAYSTADGRIIWDYNTAREYETVNGVKAKGGSIDAAGPAIADGLVVTNSGYALWKGMPGNVLLAFSK
jgi:polyvinyl alcohol dehydrogenase (cytochrome)